MGVCLWLCPKKSSPIYDRLSTLMDSLSTLFKDEPPKFEPHITITNDIDINLNDPKELKESVYQILSSSLIAITSLPKNHSDLVVLENLGTSRKYHKKLYFKAKRDPNLVSLARIMRELFVELPRETEKENKRVNGHMYAKDDNGNMVPKARKDSNKSNEPIQELDMVTIQKRAQELASEWSTSAFEPHLSLVYSDLHPIDNALWLTIKTRIQDYLNVEDCDSEVPNGLGWDNGVIKLVLCEGKVTDWIDLGSVDLH